MRRFTAVLAVMVIFFIPLTGASARTQTESGADALSWLATQINPDGSVAGFSPIGGTTDAVYAVVARDLDPNTWPAASGPRPIAYLQSVANANTSGTGDVRDDAARAAKVALAAKLAGKNPKAFGGADLIGFVSSYYNAGSGLYGTDLFDQTFAFLALRAVSEPIPSAAVDALVNAQQTNGGWEFQSGWGTDTNTTALAVQALLAARSQPVTPSQQTAIDGAIAVAVGYFHGEQNADGGFAYQQASASNFCSGANPSDANSTSYSIQAIRAAGQDPKSSAWTSASMNPIGFLFTLQSTNGSFSYQDGADCMNDSGATSQAVPGILERSFLCLLGLSACPSLEVATTASPSPSPAPAVSPSGQGTTPSEPPARRRSAARAVAAPTPAPPESLTERSVEPSTAPTSFAPVGGDETPPNRPRADQRRGDTDEPSALPWVLGFGALAAIALGSLYMAGRKRRLEG